MSLAIAGLIVSCSLSPADTQQDRPNILIITVDNVGYGDLPPFNEDSSILTPNLDKLAAEGALLTDFYTAGATCSTSRAALLTGRIPQRNKLDDQLGQIAENFDIGLPHSEILIPEVIKEGPSEYATGAFGKWNIGFAEGSRPTERGFDEFLGIPGGSVDHFTHVYAGKHTLYHNTEPVNRPGEYSTDMWADAAIDFIEEKNGNSTPWFVYLPFDAPHHPMGTNVAPGVPMTWQAPDYAFEPYEMSSDVEDPKDRFNAIVTSIDMAIGRVMDKLDSLGVADNTFVFFYSDNGAFYPYIPPESNIQSNDPFRGAGVTLYEGGIRVPAIARWPGEIEENTVISERLWSPDLFVGFTKLSGARLPGDRFIDGKDPLPLLTGQTNVSPHAGASLFFEFRNHQALIWDDYKIVREDPEAPWQLFNLEEDLSESNDLASEREEYVDKMNRVFNDSRAEIEQYVEREAKHIEREQQ